MPKDDGPADADGGKECAYCGKMNHMVAGECMACGQRFYRMCPSCGKPSWYGDIVCKYCDEPFKKYCPKCGKGAALNAEVCGKCGFVYFSAADKPPVLSEA